MPSQASGGGSKANALAAMWDKKQKAADEDQKSNPFSSKFDSSAKLKKGDAGYGTAVAGSETAMRAKKAQEWVEKEIEKLLVVIAEHGYKDADGRDAITFGKLFDTYADISDTLVGILMRARKHGKLHYAGDMLFQGTHDNIVITIGGGPPKAAAAAGGGGDAAAPIKSPAKKFAFGGGGEKCTKCGKTVYAAERVAATTKTASVVFHADCFRCTECKKKLTMSDWEMEEEGGALYCKTHYKQRMLTRGGSSGLMQSERSERVSQ